MAGKAEDEADNAVTRRIGSCGGRRQDASGTEWREVTLQLQSYRSLPCSCVLKSDTRGPCCRLERFSWVQTSLVCSVLAPRKPRFLVPSAVNRGELRGRQREGEKDCFGSSEPPGAHLGRRHPHPRGPNGTSRKAKPLVHSSTTCTSNAPICITLFVPCVSRPSAGGL